MLQGLAHLAFPSDSWHSAKCIINLGKLERRLAVQRAHHEGKQKQYPLRRPSYFSLIRLFYV